MRPFLKTWLTVCLLLPLAAHATNREQRLPSGFTGHTAKPGDPGHTVQIALAQAPVAPKAPSSHKGAKASKNSKATRISKTRTTNKHGHVANNLAQLSSKQSSTVLSRAVNVLGTPYHWGGSSPSKGFDCSGLVKYAFNNVNSVDLPRTSNAMSEGHGKKIARKDLKPGDLLFFHIESSKVNHVAIYLGNDRFIHAPRTGKAVSIDTLDKPYWQSHYVVAKRVLPKDHAPTLRLASADHVTPR